MKSTKAFILLGVLFTLVLLVSSVVAEETAQDKPEVDIEKENNQVGGRGGGKSCRWQGGCCRWSKHGYGCERCCHSAADEAGYADNQVNYGGGGGGCRHGCCGRGCRYCCANAEEARAYDLASLGNHN